MRTFVLFISVLSLASCAQMGGKSNSSTSSAPSRAVAAMQAKSGSKVKGTIIFEQAEDKLRISYVIEGLKKNSTHGFHLHEKGDCSSADAKSAGGHYNPTNVKHGSPESLEHHAGDLGNIKSDKMGKAEGIIEVSGLSISGENAIQNTAVIIHKGRDDYKSQPAGDAGDRIACGVVLIQ